MVKITQLLCLLISLISAITYQFILFCYVKRYLSTGDKKGSTLESPPNGTKLLWEGTTQETVRDKLKPSPTKVIYPTGKQQIWSETDEEKKKKLLKQCALAEDLPKNTEGGKLRVKCFSSRFLSWGTHWLSVYLKLTQSDDCEQPFFFHKNNRSTPH